LLAHAALKSRGGETRSGGGYGPHRTIYLTGIDANGKVAKGWAPLTTGLFVRAGDGAKASPATVNTAAANAICFMSSTPQQS